MFSSFIDMKKAVNIVGLTAHIKVLNLNLSELHYIY